MLVARNRDSSPYELFIMTLSPPSIRIMQAFLILIKIFPFWWNARVITEVTAAVGWLVTRKEKKNGQKMVHCTWLVTFYDEGEGIPELGLQNCSTFTDSRMCRQKVPTSDFHSFFFDKKNHLNLSDFFSFNIPYFLI